MPPMDHTIEMRRAESSQDIASAKQLILDYVDWLGVDLSFQNFDAEMAAFPGKYSPPKGLVLLALVDGTPAGVVALRPLDGEVCEMKRMWVVPEFQGLNLGREMTERLCGEAKGLGYRVMRLDTIAVATAAIHVYRSSGFREIDAYCFNPGPDPLFFERML